MVYINVNDNDLFCIVLCVEPNVKRIVCTAGSCQLRIFFLILSQCFIVCSHMQNAAFNSFVLYTMDINAHYPIQYVSHIALLLSFTPQYIWP
jgi:hypothetical protein